MSTPNMNQTTSNKRVVRQVVTFSFDTWRIISKKAQRRGVIVPDYIRHVLLNDIEDEVNNQKHEEPRMDGAVASFLEDW